MRSVTKKVTASSPERRVAVNTALITPTVQKVFLVLLVVNWMGTLLVPVMSMLMTSVRVNENLYAYIGLQSFVPPVFVVLAMPFVWRHYRGALLRWFMVGFLGLVGTISYGAFVQVETFIRYRWFPPTQYVTQPSFWEAYQTDITFLFIGLATYVAIVCIWDARLSRKK
ncbi:MAG: hypothetical protein QG629_83 [Patescibacteria group bacterium]|nr:hypothetical protein [Patescibacteria group bacterium]